MYDVYIVNLLCFCHVLERKTAKCRKYAVQKGFILLNEILRLEQFDLNLKFDFFLSFLSFVTGLQSERITLFCRAMNFSVEVIANVGIHELFCHPEQKHSG